MSATYGRRRELSAIRYYPVPPGARAVFIIEARSAKESRQAQELFDYVGQLAHVVSISEGAVMSYAVHVPGDPGEPSLFGRIERLLTTTFAFAIVERNFSDVTLRLIHDLCDDSRTHAEELPLCGICGRPDPFPCRASVDLVGEAEPAHLVYCFRCAEESGSLEPGALLRRLIGLDPRGFDIPSDIPSLPVPDLVQHKPLPDSLAVIWDDRAVRRGALYAILEAYESGDELLLNAAVLRFDVAVTDRLRALGYPRHPTAIVRICEWEAPGRTTPSLEVRLGKWFLRRDLILRDDADRPLRTWVHESIHAREPWAPDWKGEFEVWPGYEEGLASGLAVLILHRSGIAVEDNPSYSFYVDVYRELAARIGVEFETLLRKLWEYQPATIRRNFGRIVNSLYKQAGARSLSKTQLRRLRSAADAQFGREMRGQSCAANRGPCWKEVFCEP